MDLQKTQRKNRLKNIIATVIGVSLFMVAFLVARYTIQHILPDMMNQQTIAKIRTEVDDTNKKLPKMLSDKVRFDKVVMEGDKDVVYYYTLISFDSETQEFDTQTVRNAIIDEIKQEQSVMSYLKQHISLHYKLYDMNKKFFNEITVTQEDLEKK